MSAKDIKIINILDLAFYNIKRSLFDIRKQSAGQCST